MIVQLAATSAVALLSMLGGLHLYWGCGGRWWTENIVPERDGVALFPLMNAGFLVVALLLCLAAVLVALQAGLLQAAVPAWIPRVSTYAISGVFLVRAIGEFCYCGFFKTVVGTRFALWDTLVYSPVCLVLFLMTAVVALVGES